MFSVQMLGLWIIGMLIGLTAGFILQYMLAGRRHRLNQVAAYREKWHACATWELERVVNNPVNFTPEARKAATQLLSERGRLIS
jgi:hypothetical protein